MAGARHKPPVRPWLAPSANRLFGWTENGCEGTSPSAEPRFPQPGCPPSAPPPRHARRLFPSAQLPPAAATAAAAAPALPASFIRTEAPEVGGPAGPTFPSPVGRRGSRGWAEVKPPSPGAPAGSFGLSRGVQGWWWSCGGVADRARLSPRGCGEGNPGRWGTRGEGGLAGCVPLALSPASCPDRFSGGRLLSGGQVAFL